MQEENNSYSSDPTDKTKYEQNQNSASRITHLNYKYQKTSAYASTRSTNERPGKTCSLRSIKFHFRPLF